jgi:hypothetical protein
LSWIHGLEEAALEILFGVRLEVEEVEYDGSEEGCKDEENETEPVLEAEYPSDCAGEARGDELDVVYRISIEEDVGSE